MDLTGMLTKRGNKLKTWRRRYFELQNNVLCYYVYSGGPRKGEYVIDAHTTVIENNLRKHGFCLVQQNGRTLYMFADNESDKDMWMNSLREIITALQAESIHRQPKNGRKLEVSPSLQEKHKNEDSSSNNLQIHIHVIEARDLTAKGSTDTYAKVIVNAEIMQTKVLKKDLNPQWNEVFDFAWAPDARFARVEVWDNDPMLSSRDNFLGVVFLPIIPLSQEKLNPKWFKLGKRTSRSHVSGEIKILAYCDAPPDPNYLRILREVQKICSLNMGDGNFISTSDSWKVLSQDQIQKEDISFHGRFPTQFPPLECEVLEDISLMVSLCPFVERVDFAPASFTEGILLLTNYRLLFVAHSQTASRIDEGDDFSCQSLTRFDISCEICLASIVSITMTLQPDPSPSSPLPIALLDALHIKTNDAKVNPPDNTLNVNRSPSKTRSHSAEVIINSFPKTLSTGTIRRWSSIHNSMKDELTYIEASTSREGPPCQRFLTRINNKVINRLVEMQAYEVIHSELLASLFQSLSPASHMPYLSADRGLSSASPDFGLTGYRDWLSQLPPIHKAFLSTIILNGWKIYDPILECKRIGIPDEKWRISHVNADYEVCSTYPSILVVPACLDDHRIALAAQFRSRGRFPVLSWRNSENKCCLCRSSQPMVGLSQNRSVDDEVLLEAINQSSRTASDQLSSLPLVIIDARPKINAQANQAAGKGYEIGKGYENCRVLFMGIANIHVMRKSIDMLEELCCNHNLEDPNWLKNVEATGWLQHINKVLFASIRIVHCIAHQNYSVLVHCSDGWDRTAQLTSLPMLMLDPYYRTYQGFMVLVEKEWFSFGHKFADRLGWTEEGWSDNERSPVFHQFLDCVHQCLHQNPDIFEFNQDLLHFLGRHVLSGWFGNSFANCESERLNLEETTISIWSFLDINKHIYINPHFIPHSEPVWVPNSSIKCLVIWELWFLNWSNQVWNLNWSKKNEDFSEVFENHSIWMEDEMVQNCCGCQLQFNFIRRRHHCRACGRIFCENCVRSMKIIPHISETPVKCCDECSNHLTLNEEDAIDEPHQVTNYSAGLYGQNSVPGNLHLENESFSMSQGMNKFQSSLVEDSGGRTDQFKTSTDIIEGESDGICEIEDETESFTRYPDEKQIASILIDPATGFPDHPHRIPQNPNSIDHLLLSTVNHKPFEGLQDSDSSSEDDGLGDAVILEINKTQSQSSEDWKPDDIDRSYDQNRNSMMKSSKVENQKKSKVPKDSREGNKRHKSTKTKPRSKSHSPSRSRSPKKR